MEYNKKEQLFDEINGLMINNPCSKENWINKGISEVFKRTENFFNKELVPEVPQYVADWYEENKDNLDYNLWNYIMDWEDTEEDSFKRWVNNSKDAFQTIINMHQFGYKIKNEKKYLVQLRGVNCTTGVLKCIFNRVWYMGDDLEYENIKVYHTEEELKKAGFGGVFGNPVFEVVEESND